VTPEWLMRPETVFQTAYSRRKKFQELLVILINSVHRVQNISLEPEAKLNLNYEIHDQSSS
jgi:hypothetical protein